MFDKGLREYGLFAICAGLEKAGREITHRFNSVNESKLWDVPILAGRVKNPCDRFIIEEGGEDPEGELLWPIPGTPSEVTLNELQEHIMMKGGANLKEWVPDLNNTEEGLVVCDFINDAYQGMIEAYEGETLEWEIVLSGAEKLTNDLIEGREEWPEGATEPEAIAWIENKLKEMEEEGHF